MFLHVSVDRILGDVFVDIKFVFLDIFPRFLEHHKKHGFLIVKAAREIKRKFKQKTLEH
jgi:hypothetical protein